MNMIIYSPHFYAGERGLRPSIGTRKEVIRVLEFRNEKGQGLVEYALILVLVAIVVIAILLLLGPIIGNAFSNIVANL
jgi:pilus assembly protein Flp/PilA